MDSARIGGNRADTAGGIRLSQVDLGPPGGESRIRIQAWDERGNRTDSVLVVLRDPVPNGLPPTYRWIQPDGKSPTTIPYDSSGIWIRCMLEDISGIDAGSVKIGGLPATALDDTTWTARVMLPPTGKEVVVTLEAKNLRGVSVSSFVGVTRRRDTVPPTCERVSVRTAVVPFDTVSLPVAWTARDNDRVAKTWIQGQPVVESAQKYAATVLLAVGTQWIRFLAEDPAGNAVRDSFLVERRPDTLPPRLERLPGTAARTVPFDTASIEVGWQAADNDRVAKAWIQGVEVNASSEGYSRLVALDTGTQWIHFRAQDPTGNESLDSFRMERRDLDTADPVVASDTVSRLRGGSFLVELSTTTPFWRIHYTLDGSDPTEASPRYGYEPGSNHDGQWGVWIDTTCTLKARAFASNRSPGRILTQTYRLALPVAVAGGYHHSLFLLSDGSLWAAGSNARNAFATSAQEDFPLPVKIADSVVEMGAGREFSIWLKQDGSLWGIGANDSGQLGIGTNTDVKTPALIATEVKSAQAILEQRILVLKNDGTLWGAGANGYGQLGTGNLASPNRLVPIATDVARFGGGGPYSMFVKKDGGLWSMGSPYHGKLGFDTTDWVTTPRKVMDSIADIAGTMTNSSLVLTTSGKLLGFGWNHEGQLGTGDTANLLKPTSLPLFETGGRISKVVSRNHTLALTENGTLLGTGWNATSGLNTTLPEINPTPVVLMRDIQTMGIGLGHSFAITKSGCLFGWGANNKGQLGDGTVGWNYGVARVKF